MVLTPCITGDVLKVKRTMWPPLRRTASSAGIPFTVKSLPSRVAEFTTSLASTEKSVTGNVTTMPQASLVTEQDGGVGVGVRLGVAVGVGPPVTSRNAAPIGPQVWKPWKSLTPRPCSKITWRPTDRLAVFMVASTATLGELNVPFIGTAVPPAQGGVSM